MMEKKLYFLLCAFCLSILISCSDKDDKVNYALTDLIGKYELQNSTSEDYVKCTESPVIFEITETELSIPIINTANGCQFGTTIWQHEYASNKFSIEFGGYKVKSFDGSILVWKYSFLGFSYEETLRKK
jgi:hypothetical protein